MEWTLQQKKSWFDAGEQKNNNNTEMFIYSTKDRIAMHIAHRIEMVESPVNAFVPVLPPLNWYGKP